MDEAYTDDNSSHLGTLYFLTALAALLIHQSALQHSKEVIITLIHLPETEGFPVHGAFSAKTWGVPSTLEWLITLKEAKDPNVTSQGQNLNSHPRFPDGNPVFFHSTTLTQPLEILNFPISDHILPINQNKKDFIFLEISFFKHFSFMKQMTSILALSP